MIPPRFGTLVVWVSILFALAAAVPAGAQQPMDPPPLYPPPLSAGESEEDEDEEADDEKQPLPRDPRINPESDRPWGLDADLLDRLEHRADLYRDYAIRFTCTETARIADYDGSGDVGSEKTRRYAYLLERDERAERFVENRQRLSREGKLKEQVDDDEPFPPAYAWVFLFADINRPFMAFRDLGDRFEGFDWVRVIQFRGALSFTNGRDIREWEGTVLVDATTLTPIEIHAQPSGQSERILAQFRRWNRSFNLIGFRLGPKPLAYRSHVQFRLRRDGLTFPTELRYDTLRAVSPRDSRSVRASTRTYDDYRFFRTGTEEEFRTSATD